MAKSFKFRLEVVLKERKRIEDAKLQEWTLARQIMIKMKDARDKMAERLELAISEGTQLASLPKNSSAEFFALDRFIAGLKTRLEWKKREIERGEKLTEKKRLEYVLASQKRQALEKLKERKHNEYKDELRHREMKELDDIYIMRAGIKRLDEDDAEVAAL